MPPPRKQSAKDPMFTDFPSIAKLVNQRLKTRAFILGDDFSAADIVNGAGMMWADRLGLLDGFNAIRDWLAKLQNRSAYKRAQIL